MRHLTRFLLLFSVAIAFHSAAQEPDLNNKRGFEAGKVYNFFGIDSVSPFSGNLTVPIPIGQSYSVRPGFSYQFFLTNNSRAWDYELQTLESGDDVRYSAPERYSNAGLGWLLTLGRVLPPSSSNGWTYASPDGANHEFFGGSDPGVLYTMDNTYLRMKLTPRNATAPSAVTRVEVETADGLKHAFTGAGELIEIRDGYGNWLQVTRNGNVWTFEDGRGEGSQRKVARTHVLTLEDAPVGRYPSDRTNFLKRVKTLELAAFAATGQSAADAKAVYTFQYDDATIDANNCTSPGIPGGWTPAPTWNVPLLTQIDLPDGSSYLTEYHRMNTSTCSSGALTKLTLPTKGAISWTYGTYMMARDVCIIEPYHPGAVWSDQYPGVIKRTMASADGQILEETTYVPELVARADRDTIVCGKNTHLNFELPPKVFKNKVTSSTAGSTVHYFSAFRAWEPRYAVGDASPGDYGLPFTWTEMRDALPLSAKTYDAQQTLLRSTYVEYETHVAAGVGQHGDARPKRSRTVFHGDTGDPQPGADGVDTEALRCKTGTTVVDCWVEQRNSDFDGFGHYRTQETSSNFAGSTTRTVFTNYNPGITAWEIAWPWVLNTHTDASVTEGIATRSSSSTFDAAGTLISTQTGTGNGALVSATCRDASGFITSQRWLGGGTLAPPAGPCTAARRDGEAFLVHENVFTDGALTSHTATWDGTPVDGNGIRFKAIDETLDANTGLASSTRDGAGLETTYTFDTSSRITSITPPGTAKSSYVYTNATFSPPNAWTPATVLATTPSSVVALGVIGNEYQYDAVGRLWREKTLMPDATWSVRETLYDSRGRRQSVSEMQTLVVPPGGTEYMFTPANKTSFGGYDVFGRVGTITAPDSKTITFEYQGSRLTKRTVNMALGLDGEAPVVTVERTDAHGRLASVTEADGTPEAMTTSYGYDVSGQLGTVTMTAAAGTQSRTFIYDARNLLSKETHPELGAAGGGTIEYSDFTAQGQPRRRKTGSATAFDLTMEYDAAGRLTLLKRTTGAVDLKAFQYDPATGRLSATARYNQLPDLGTIAVTEGLGYHTVHGRLVRRDVAIGASAAFSGGRSYANTRIFDDIGGVSATGYPFRTNADGTPAETQRSVSYSRRNGHLTGITGWATLQYQPNGAIAKVTHNGDVTETWTADPNGMARPRQITVARGTTTHWSSGVYDFDAAGNIKSIGSLAYTYDRLGRLSHWRSGAAASYTAEGIIYDPFGNRVGTTLSGCTGPLQCYTTGVTARAITGTTNHFADSTYDAAGNVIGDAGRTFTYDAVNMTTAITAGGKTFRYLYTADDERVAAVESLANGGYKTTWTLRGLNSELLTVLDGDTWKEDRIWRGSTVAGFNTPAGKRHQSVDHLGSPRVITDDTGNMVGGIQQFTPFGSGGSVGAGALQFTGHERDQSMLGGGTTALPDYMHARYYDPNLGRFLSVDPVLDVKRAMREPQSWNRYSYVVNNPINRIDPDGRVDQNWDGGAAQQLFPDDRSAQLEFDQGVAEKTAALGAAFVGGLAVRGAIAGGVALYRSFQVANTLRVAAAGGAALSGGTRDMATQAFKMTASLPGTAAQKVQYFQSLANQISKASGGAWNAAKIAGPNGSTVFFGKAGEALVINSKGQVFRGQLGTAVKVVKDTAEIAWDKMKLVQ